MVLFLSNVVGVLLLIIVIITTISYLVLNIVSFAGNHWIIYVDVPVRFGLWRVCDTTTSGLCNAWVNQFASNITSQTFNDEKPGFIRTAQALEIISLIFYVQAAVFIIIGIFNCRAFRSTIAFAIAIILLFICIVFLSATLGVMSVQGRDNHPFAYLGWAWWVGLAGLIVTIVCWIALIGLLLSTAIPPSSSDNVEKISRNFPVLNQWDDLNYLPSILPENPSIFPAEFNPPIFPPEFNPPIFPAELNPPIFPMEFDPPIYYDVQYPPTYPYDEYFNEQNPSPVMSELTEQFVLRMKDALYERQLLQGYQ